MKIIYKIFYNYIVKYIYADHNRNLKVRRTLNKLIKKNIEGIVINIGSEMKGYMRK